MPAIVFRQGDEAADELGLVDPAGQRGFSLPAFTGPAGLANQHVLGGEAVAEHLAHLGHVVQGGVDVRRIIFPVRQQVDGEEIHRRGDFRVLEPELPDIGVGHRLLDPGLDLEDQPRQLRAGDLLAQQCFVTDDHRTDHVRVGVGRGDQQVDFLFGVHRVAVDPGADHQLQAVLARQVRQGFQAGHGIGTDAFETGRQQGQVGVHALRAQLERLVEGRLVLVERSVGSALQLVAGAGDIRQVHRPAKAVPITAEGQQPEQAGEQIGQGGETRGGGHDRAVVEQSRASYPHLSAAWWAA